MLRTFKRGFQGRIAGFDVTGNIFDHHNRVVDDEPGRDRQRHQREIVETEIEEIHHDEGANQRQRHRKARNNGRRKRSQEEEDHEDDKGHRKRQLELDIRDGGTNGRRTVAQNLDIDGGGKIGDNRGQQLLDCVDNLDHIRPRLAADAQDDRRIRIVESSEL